jgi:hypothetical protein
VTAGATASTSGNDPERPANPEGGKEHLKAFARQPQSIRKEKP